MDLHSFKLLRSPRAVGDDYNRAELTGDATKQLTKLLSTPDAKAALAQANKFATDWIKAKEDPLDWVRGNRSVSNDAEKALDVCGATDRWLLARSDKPSGKEFAEFRKEKLKNLVSPDLSSPRVLVSNWVAIEYILRRDLDRLRILTRVLLIIDILSPVLLPDGLLAKDKPGDPVWNWLHRRSVVMPPQFQMASSAPHIVELVRGAKVSDLFVVRSEWSCYKAAEVANIINVLAGESFSQELRKTQEEETITREDTETLEIKEQTEEDRTQTDLSREIDRAASAAVSAEGSFNVSGQYGVTQFGASGSASASASLAESSRTASRISRDLVSKAVSKVESRVREERTKRRLTKLEDLVKHGIDNTGNPHMRGVFRWLDRVDRYQVFRFPDRLLLEFEIPEPAEYFRWRIDNRQSNDPTAVSEPPEFDVTPDSITRGEYADLALKYRAANLPPPPDETLGISATTSADSALEPEDGKTLWAKPVIHKTGDVAVPAGYLAESISFSGTATPFMGKWEVESDNRQPVANSTPIQGFHQIVVSVCAGDMRYTGSVPQATSTFKTFSVQIEGNKLEFGRTKRRFANAFLHFDDEELTFDPPVKDKASYSISCTGAKSIAASINITCKLSASAFAEWQNAVYDILMDAWRAWRQEYRTQELQRGAGKLTGFNATSPARNKEIIAEELKRQAITWLLDDQNFSGKDAMVVRANNWDMMSLQKARQVAPMLQFLEQAFEWSSLTYFFYPYFWARGSRWDNLADLEANDPEFAKFLRSGSARVIVPARPGFDDAVMFWLLYQEPFLGGPMPLPGDPLYVGIDREIQDLTRGPDDGDPQDCWEARMGTPLLWLDASPNLPVNDTRQLGKAPNEPINPLC